MSGLIFERLEQAKEYIKERIQLSDLVARHTKLVREPRGFKCLCPLPGHKEKTPSFHIDTRKNLFYCYGCSKGGDIFEFVQQVEGLSFMDALKEFAEQLNVQLPKQGSSSGGAAVSGGYKDTLTLLDRAAKFFHRCLLEDESSEVQQARAYLKERGISESDWVQFGVGWAPSRRDAIAKTLKSSEEKTLALNAGLVSQYQSKLYDFFSARLMIPIRDVRGRVLAFSGRSLEPVTAKNPKYKNSPETELFKKKWVLYGLGDSLSLMRQKDYVVVVEGFFDQWALLRREIPSAAVMGTALTEDHAKTLKKYCSEVILFLDADDAGEKAVLRSLPILVAEGIDTKVFVAPTGKDPDEWLSQGSKIGAEALESQLRSATEGLQWWAEYKVAQAEKSGLNVVQIMKSLAEVWALAPTLAHRRILAQALCSVASMTPEQFLSSMNSMAKPQAELRARPQTSSPSALKIPKLDPLAVELFETWIRGWTVLTPKSHSAWEAREELFRGTALHGLVIELSSHFAREHGQLALSVAEAMVEAQAGIDQASLGRFKRAFFEAHADIVDPQKVEVAFSELSQMAKNRRIDAEIAQIRQKIKKLPENSSETEQLLHAIEELLHKRNNDLEKNGKGTSVGPL